MRKKYSNVSSERQKSVRQTIHQRGGQRDSSPHYVLLYSDDEYSGGNENIPLVNHGQSTALPQKVEVIKIQLQPEETLPAIALKYRCTVSELKRINKIHQDNEIFARRTIKVPVQPYSILAETLAEAAEERIIGNDTQQPSTSKEEQIINLIATPIVPKLQNSQINNIIFNSTCEPLSHFESSENGEDADDVQLLNPSRREVSPKITLIDTFKCSGADWGLSWLQLLGVSLLLGLAVPIIYYICVSSIYENSFQTTVNLNSSG